MGFEPLTNLETVFIAATKPSTVSWINEKSRVGCNEPIFIDTSTTNIIDTSATKSSFQYDEGDFFQDEFSAMVRFNGNSRNIQLNAYKRSFFNRLK